MPSACDLEVNVNNQHTFFLHKEKLFSYSGKLKARFSRASEKNLKCFRVVLHDFPGGVRAFEMVCRFCYGANVDMKHGNVLVLHCAANYLEMNEKMRPGNLVAKTEKYLREQIAFLNWAEMVSMIRDCENLLPASESCGLVARLIDAAVLKMKNRLTDVDNVISPVPSSPESFGFGVRYSSDTRSSDRSCKTGWWFEDLACLGIFMTERIVKRMLAHNMDHNLVAKFLLHHLKSAVPALGFGSLAPKRDAILQQQCHVSCNCSSSPRLRKDFMESMVELMSLLEQGSVPCRSLFVLLRMASILNVSAFCRKQLEMMIGFQLDQASLDNIVVPAPPSAKWMYDVDLVLRLLQVFLGQPEVRRGSQRFAKVEALLDSYIMEVSPDLNLSPSKFQQLLEALPDDARSSSDMLYRALDMFIEAHPKMSDEEGVSICRAINYSKLSFEASKHLSHNPRIPTAVALHVLMLQQSSLRDALNRYHSHPHADAPETPSTSASSSTASGDLNTVLLCSKDVDVDYHSENSDLKADLEGMHWRVMELEQACRKLQFQFTKVAKLKRRGNASRLPRLCS
eukprot:TRINITY_DN2868_c0_g1_i4.p1 TRINITY_DN2868_c0_g1~~TRINITY_DN2868_c0_g1_i4.p1  ORF type:complete len:568 (+),score=21.69 TRINITY_DN2868_c0_g1_i4:326-2029(+)